MASITLQSPQRFPVGTTVAAYKRSNWGQSDLPPAGAPQGASDASAVVAANGSVALTGLTDAVDYFAYALVGGEHRYVSFSTAFSSGASLTNTELRAAAVPTADSALAALLDGTQVDLFNGPSVFPASIGGGAQVNAHDLAGIPANLRVGGKLVVLVRNPSIVTALSCQLEAKGADPSGGETIGYKQSGSGGPAPFTVPVASTKAATISAATDVVTSAGHGSQNGDKVIFTALTGGAGLVVGTTYFVRDATIDTFKVAATQGGAAINVTSDASAATLTFGQNDANDLEGSLLAAGGRLLVTNQSALGAGQGFTASVRVYAVPGG
jgi:hypothetical protein